MLSQCTTVLMLIFVAIDFLESIPINFSKLQYPLYKTLSFVNDFSITENHKNNIFYQ